MAGPDIANKFPAAELPASPAADDAVVLTEHVAEIRRRGIRAKEDIIEIGRRLADAKKRVGHGRWLKWLEHNLGWTVKTAQRFTSVYEFSQAEIFEYDKLSNLNLPISAIYLLAAPSTPEEACVEIVERARAGETPPVAAIQRTIDTAKDHEQPAKKTRNYTAEITGRRPKPALVVVGGTDVVARVPEHEDKDARIAELENKVQQLECELEELKATKPLDLLRAISNEQLLGELEHRLPAKFWNQYPSTWKAMKAIIQAL